MAQPMVSGEHRRVQLLLLSRMQFPIKRGKCLNSVLNKQRRQETKRHFSDKVAQLAVKNGKNN